MCPLVVEDFDSLVPCLKTENDVKLCLSTWVTLCLNMAERCWHKKCHLCFILFVYAFLVHALVGHISNIDCVVCIWLWNIFVMILVTMNERQQVFRCENIVALTYIFFTYIKKMVYLTENRQRKHNKLSNRPFTTFILKVTNPFNVETHHM